MSRPALIFDIDGTLWDSREIVARGWNHHLAEIGREDLFVNKESLKSLFGKTMTEIADIAFASIPVPERYEVLQVCMEEEHRFLEEDPCSIGFPGITETLTELSARGYDLYIVSNAQCGYPELCIDKLGLKDYVQGHMCFGDTGTSKGKTIRTLMAKHDIRRFFKGWMCFGDTGEAKGVTIRALMERHGVETAHYIGDTQGDLEASRMAGLPFVFCRYGFGNPAEFESVIDAFPQLLELYP